METVLEMLPDRATSLAGDVEYDYSDAEFEEVVRRVIREEVYQGEGSSFVTPRKATCTRPPFEDLGRVLQGVLWCAKVCRRITLQGLP